MKSVEQIPIPDWLRRMWPVLIVLWAVALIVWNSNAPIGDFGNGYFGAYFWSNGVEAHALFDPYDFNALIDELGYPEVYLNHAVVSPITDLVSAPFMWMPVGMAKMAFNAISLLLFLLSLYRWGTKVELNQASFLLVVLLSSWTFHANIHQGQVYFLLLAIMLESWMFFMREKWAQGGMLLAFVILWKIFPAILFVPLLGRRHFRAIVWTLAGMVLLVLVTLVLVPVDYWVAFAQSVPRMLQNEFNDPYSVSYQSFSTLWRRLFVEDAILNPAPFMVFPTLGLLLDAFVKGVLLIVFTWMVFTGSKDHPWRMAAFTLWFVVAFSGYSTQYAQILALPYLLVLLSNPGRGDWLIAVFVWLPLTLPVHWFGDLPTALQYPRLWLNVVALIVAIWIHQYKYPWKPRFILAGAIVLAWLGLQNRRTDFHSELIALPEATLLAAGIEPSEDGLIVSYYGRDGKHDVRLNLDIEEVDESFIKVKNGALVTKDGVVVSRNYRYKDPILVNGRDLYYLSDEGRGVGFFALRKIAFRNPETPETGE